MAKLLIAARGADRARHSLGDRARNAQIPRAQRGMMLRARELRALPCDRQGEPEPAHDRAAVPQPAHAIPDRKSSKRRSAEGIVTGHPTMPEFRLDPGQIADVIAYFKTLER